MSSQCALGAECPRTACFYAHRTLADLIDSGDFRDIAGDQIRRFRLLKDLGNKAVHRPDPTRRCAIRAIGEALEKDRRKVLL